MISPMLGAAAANSTRNSPAPFSIDPLGFVEHRTVDLRTVATVLVFPGGYELPGGTLFAPQVMVLIDLHLINGD